jgi:hypothetical protein
MRRSGEGRNRTGDTTVFSRVLYQLSYLAAATKCSPAGFPGRGAGPEPGFARAQARFCPVAVRGVGAFICRNVEAVLLAAGSLLPAERRRRYTTNAWRQRFTIRHWRYTISAVIRNIESVAAAA